MKYVNQSIELASKLCRDPISEKPKRPQGIEPSIWQKVWSRLEASKVIWEELDSTVSEYWRINLDGHSYDDLMRGCDAASDWKRSKSDFTLGAFKELCKRPTHHPSHQLFIENNPGTKLSKEENKRRFAELRAANGFEEPE